MEELRRDYFAKIMVTGKTEIEFVRIGASEPFDYETGTSDTAEFSSVAAGGSSGFKNISVLEPSKTPRRLTWNEWGIKDGCKYYIKVPTGTNRLGTDKDLDVGFITNGKSPYFAPNSLYGFWLIQDYYPAVSADNPTAGAITPKVYFRGMKYDIESVEDKNILEKLQNYDRGISPSIPFTVITIGGVKT